MRWLMNGTRAMLANRATKGATITSGIVGMPPGPNWGLTTLTRLAPATNPTTALSAHTHGPCRSVYHATLLSPFIAGGPCAGGQPAAQQQEGQARGEHADAVGGEVRQL